MVRMRLWSIHPKYLDAKGLVALWREALLARAVLRGETQGYRHHPQLARFAAHPQPRRAIEAYLNAVLEEAHRRGYTFDARKVRKTTGVKPIGVNRGQVSYEVAHLLAKLKRRNPARWREQRRLTRWTVHPMMRVRTGEVEEWERT